MSGSVKKGRNINIELLRIISVFIIIFNHYSIYGGFEYDNPLTLNAFIIEFLHLGGKIGVDIFIFISGWFMSTSTKFDVRRIIKLCLQVLFYSVILAALGNILNTLSKEDTVRMLGAIPFSNWIFITSYFMLFCLSPFLNIIIRNISKRQFVTLLIFLGVTWCVIPTFIPADFDMSNTSWYIYLYLLAGFMRKYEADLPKNPKKWLAIGLGSLFLILLSEVVLEFMGVYVAPVFGHHAEHFRNMNSILVLFTVVGVFMGIVQQKPRYNSVVPKIASTSLAVFILHDNRALRPVIWTKIFKTTSYADSHILIIHAFITAIIVFVVTGIIDLIRQYTIERWVMKLIDPIISKAEIKYKMFLDKHIGESEK